VKKVRTTRFRMTFWKFFSPWLEQFLCGVGDRERSERESHRRKNTKTGGSDPTSLPRKPWRSLQPSDTVIRAACFST
jgi:hypothetical protein